VYLFRNPLDVLFSYWPYLQSIPYDNFKCKNYDNIVEFAKDPDWGLQIIINFMNEMILHFNNHRSPKLAITYEAMKNDENTWKKLIEFTCKNFDQKAYEYAKSLTSFQKMQKKNDSSKPKNLHFYRKGGSNYISELPTYQQELLNNWPGLKELTVKIKNLNIDIQK